jgi:hypothetical protein
VQYTFLFTEICLRQVHDIPATRLIERHAPDFFPGHRRNSLVMGRFVAGEIGVARVSGQGQLLAAAAAAVEFAPIARPARFGIQTMHRNALKAGFERQMARNE